MNLQLPLLLLLAAAPQDGGAPAVWPELAAPTPTEPRPLAAAPDRAADTLRFYDVADLVARDRGVPDFPPSPSGPDRGPQGDRADPGATRAALDDLVELLRENLPETAGTTRLEVLGDTVLSVRGPAGAHDFVEDFLLAQRSATSPILLEFRILTLPRGRLAELGVEGASHLFEGPGALEAFLERVQEGDDVDLLNAPSIACYGRQRANLSIINQVAYVRDYEVQVVEPGGITLADPIVDVVHEGLVLDVRPVPLPGHVVQFDVDLLQTELERPIRTARIDLPIPGANEVTIGLPEVHEARLSALLTLAAGGSALFTTATPDGTGELVVVLTFPGLLPVESLPVTELFAAMLERRYRHVWYPELTWADGAALLARAEGAEAGRALASFPTNPLSSQTLDAAVEGVVALWLLEGLRHGGNLPSLLPALGGEGAGLAVADQLRLLPKAVAAYRAWWDASGDRPTDPDAPGPSPLEGTGLTWR